MTSPTTQAQAREAVELPELPDPKYIYHNDDDNGEDELFEFAHSGAVDLNESDNDSTCPDCERLYTGDQMRAYALSVSAAKQEELDKMREESNVASVGEFAAQSANRHLSALVDFERQVSERCMAVMKALMDAAEPVNNEFQDCHIDYADYAKFVDAHAELLYVIKNGERPAAPSPIQGAKE